MQLGPLPCVIGGNEQCLCETDFFFFLKAFLLRVLVPQLALFNKGPPEVMRSVIYLPPPQRKADTLDTDRKMSVQSQHMCVHFSVYISKTFKCKVIFENSAGVVSH